MTDTPWISVSNQKPFVRDGKISDVIAVIPRWMPGDWIKCYVLKGGAVTREDGGLIKIGEIVFWQHLPPVPKPEPQVTGGEWRVVPMNELMAEMTGSKNPVFYLVQTDTETVAKVLTNAADARLIAESKELLKSLETIIAYFAGLLSGNPIYTAVIESARITVGYATGKAKRVQP